MRSGRGLGLFPAGVLSLAMSVRRRILLTLIACLTVALCAAADASAAPTIELTQGSVEPVESITTQLGATVHEGTDDLFSLSVQPAGGEACGENPEADKGEELVRTEDIGDADPFASTNNWTAQIAGTYRLCAWVTGPSEEEVLTHTESTFHVRQPHLTVAISVPAAVTPNQTFQVVTTAEAETERSVWEYALPNTGDGCPANAAAAANASGSNAILNVWNVIGGPLTESANDSLQTLGTYLFCAYVEYPSDESIPELTASAQTAVVAPPAPCVVPGIASGATPASVEAAIRSGSCSVGKVSYESSEHVSRGRVVAVEPGSGTKLGSGAAVNLVLSAGKPCVVPAVGSGWVVGRAERALAAADCRPVIVHARSRRVRRGRVIGLSARTGSRLSPQASVRIVVSAGR